MTAKKIKVPHIKQSRQSSCGAAALAMVYKFYKLDNLGESTIWEKLKVARPNLPGQFFLKTIDMINDGANQGLSFFWGQAVLDSEEFATQPLEEFLKLGVPVIVCQKISDTNMFGHFRVVVGIENGKIYYNDPLRDQGNSSLLIKEFVSLWQNANNGEVIGGEFFAIFDKKKVNIMNKFLVSTFRSSIKHFTVTALGLI